MAKGAKLSEFEKGKITAQREILKVLGCSKTIICNYLKSPNKYGARKPSGKPEKLSPQFRRRIVREVKKKTSWTSKILKSLVDAPCSTRTIRRHLNNENIKHKKRIHHSRLTIGTKYHNFSAEKKFNSDGPEGFQKYWLAKYFPE